MPNIEMHGFRFSSVEVEKQQVKEIYDLFEGKPYRDEMVVDVYHDTVYGPDLFDQPFLRLVNSCEEHTEEILKTLKVLNIDIEHAKLEDFFPRLVSTKD